MSLWFALALMTFAGAAAVLWPLSRREELVGGSDIEVYRDQLGEIERDRRLGLLAAGEADAARAEVARRLLAAADKRPQDGANATAYRRVVAVLALVLIPTVAVSLYAYLGSPSLPSAPLSARLNQPLEQRSIETLVAEVEKRLEANPNDSRGWEVLAPVYQRLGRYEDLVKARRTILRLAGATASREADLGEALVYLANGMVTAEAREAFQRALALDAKDARARYFVGVAFEQDGKPMEARTIWQALLADAPADAVWLPVVRSAIARVTSEGPGADQIAAAETLPPAERAAMVRGMVERLAARLATEGGDEEAWLRLIRAYVVLKEPDNARKAAHDARRAAGSDNARLKRIDDFVKSLGLET